MNRRDFVRMTMGLPLVFGACKEASKEMTHRAPSGAPNIVLVTIDTLRWDHVGAYGYSKKTTPFIDQLSRAGVSFDNAWSTSSWTVPSLASLITGEYPATHGVVHGLISQGRIERQQSLPPTLPSVAEKLKSLGYRTFGITANRHLMPPFGFGRGFDLYRCLGFANAEAVAKTFKDIKPSLAGAAPFFLWVHFLDPHAPYKARQPYFSQFNPNKAYFELLAATKSGKKFKDHAIEQGSAEQQFVLNLYDSEIRHTDAVMKNIVSETTGNGNTAVVFTTDHGEAFGDHNSWGHGQTLFHETCKIPLVIQLPGNLHAGMRVPMPASLVDIHPTLLGLTRSHVKTDGAGINLLADSTQQHFDRDIHLSLSRGAELRGIIRNDWKYIYNLRHPKKSLLFNLKQDALERNNLNNQETKIAMNLRNAIIDMQLSISGKLHSAGNVTISKEHLQQLKALGYVE